MEPRIWLIAGPTASGKSALALRLAREIGAEIVNADALQLYADLRLLTARPSPEEEAQAPHHLFGTVDAAEGWSVGRWLRAAVALTGEIAARSRPTVIVGGTGLYFRALTHGLAEVPDTPPQIRSGPPPSSKPWARPPSANGWPGPTRPPRRVSRRLTASA